MNVEEYQTVFLTPDSNVWNPYDESHKKNEDSNLDNRGRMVLPSTPTQHCLVRDSEVSAMKQVTDENDVAMNATDNFSYPSVTWRDDMLSKKEESKVNKQASQNQSQCEL